MEISTATPKEIKTFIKKVVKKHDNNSPFSTPRESEITEKQEKKQVLVFKENGQICGVIIARELLQNQTMKDFAQRSFRFEAGTVLISDFVFSKELTQEEFDFTFESVVTQFNNYRVSVELYAEDFANVNHFQGLSLQKTMTKISAFAEIKNIYSNCFQPTQALFNDCVENFLAEEASLLVIEPNFLTENQRQAILLELTEALKFAKFANHYSIYNKDNSWSGVTIQGFKREEPGFIEKPTEMSKRWKKENSALLSLECQETVIAEHFHFTLSHLKTFFKKLERVRILKLNGNGEILRHCDIQDKDAGVADSKIARFHIPLVTNPHVYFTVWNSDGNKKYMAMPESSLCYLDHRKPHAVSNLSSNERLHLVVDVYSDEAVRKLIASAYEIENFYKQKGE